MLSLPGPYRLILLWLVFAVGGMSVGPRVNAEVSCAPIFTDHLVLQREVPVTVWGEASAGEVITVSFAGQAHTTHADAAGHWAVTLAPLPASATPRDLIVGGTNQLIFSDVLVGEVWFCSGQSNMEKPLGPRKNQEPTDDYPAALLESERPLLRLFQVPRSDLPQSGPGVRRWLPCTPSTLVTSEFSAAAYYFGMRLQQELGVPVGLIHSSFGGTRIEAWTPKSALEREPPLRDLVNLRYASWVPGVQPTELYQSMVTPYVPYAVRGFLWYQGETNLLSGDGPEYTLKQQTLVRSWREAWRRPDAPFYFVLLAPFEYSERENANFTLTRLALPLFWEAQVAATKEPHTGFVVTTDLVANVRDIHPTNKHDVGDRLARLALRHTYGHESVLADGPTFSELAPTEGALLVRFRNAAGLRTRDGGPLTGFAVAGEDRVFHPATAELRGETIVVRNPTVPQPIALRFGWDETPTLNLENGAGLPAVPFRTDDWPVEQLRTTLAADAAAAGN